MNLVEIILIGLVLSVDSFSAALAMGFRPHRSADVLKLACSSSGAEAFATVFGALTGEKLVLRFSGVAHWIAFILLLVVALHMAYEGYTEYRSNGKHENNQFHGFMTILLVSLATSIDALAVGVSLGINNKPLLPFTFSIGFWAFVSTVVGMALAKKAPRSLGPVFTWLGSLILLLLAGASVGD